VPAGTGRSCAPVVLVAPQRAHHAQLGADEVLEALAALLQFVGDRPPVSVNGVPPARVCARPLRVDAVVVAVQADHAAGMRGRRLRRDRDRLELLGAALAPQPVSLHVSAP
jgi:hypothetical protein